MGGDDVIVHTGLDFGYVYGDSPEYRENDGNDVITIVGDWASVFAGGGDDVITITGDNAGGWKEMQGETNAIDGGKGDDTIIIYGQDAKVIGGDDQDACAAGTNPVSVESCETYL